MARKRMIHRDIWQSYDIAKCNYRQRLLFIGIITIADDEGRSKAEETIIQGDIFPYDKLSRNAIKTDLEHLDKLGLIHYYKCNCIEKYIQVTNWKDYQKIDHPIPSKIPAYLEISSGIIREQIENSLRNNSENFSPNSNSNSNCNSNPKKKGNKKPVDNSLTPKEKYNYRKGMDKERENQKLKDELKQENILINAAKDCYKTPFDLGEPCPGKHIGDDDKKPLLDKCKVCLPLQDTFKADYNKVVNPTVQTYAQCENFILKNCYFKDQGKEKHKFCLQCSQDSSWGEEQNHWGNSIIKRKDK